MILSKIGETAMNIPKWKSVGAAGVACLLLAGIADASHSTLTQRIEPATIGLGDAARLTISASGDDGAAITPPMVAGLEFVAVGQTRQIESINGVTHSTSAVTYEVIPRQVGVFTIPGGTPGSQPVVLTVNPTNPATGHAASQWPQSTAGNLPAASTRLTADGSAFVRLRLPKHDLYVGETIPVDIQVGMREGFVASLNGLPVLNGDAFTMSKLSSHPQQAEELIAGKPFTVLTWHSTLSAVKPGDLSLRIETPLTVRMRTPAAARTDTFGDANLDDLFNDPSFQNFFGGSTEKEITVASTPTAFTVLELPARNRPADFSGAVGHYTISSSVSDDQAAVGDPITLRLRVSGTGNFDRVISPMLHDVGGWKTYSATAKFQPGDEIGFRGEKTFEQPIIAMQPGAQAIPALSFSWFDPNTRQYVDAKTSSLTVAVTPASAQSSSAADAPAPPSSASVVSSNNATNDGLRADHVDDARRVASLMPLYYQPRSLGLPSLLALAFSGAWIWVRRRERAAARAEASGEGSVSARTEVLVSLMVEAGARNDAEAFFRSARTALQRALAAQWRVAPETITRDDLDAHLGAKSVPARIFTLADEAAYAGIGPNKIDFQRWTQVVLQQLKRIEARP
jgi:BatD DUF11 like domain